jgi:hypothetical protein
MTKQTPDDKKPEETLPNTPKAGARASFRPPETKAQRAAFKRKDKAIFKPAMRK